MAEMQHGPAESAISNVQIQMIETKTWKKMDMHLEADKCLQCFECTAGVIYLTSGLLSSPRKEGLKRDNRAVKVLMTAWAVEKDFAGRYKLKWD